MEIFSGSFLLFCPSRSDVRKNINTLESCFIEDIKVVILIESGTWFFMFNPGKTIGKDHKETSEN